MARICYQFPVQDVHGQFQKKGIIFKVHGETYYTQQYAERTTPTTSAELAARERFKNVVRKVAEYRNDPDTLNDIRADFRNQSRYKSFNKFLWYTAKTELGY